MGKCRNIYMKFPNTKFHKNLSDGSRCVPYAMTEGLTHTSKITRHILLPKRLKCKAYNERGKFGRILVLKCSWDIFFGYLSQIFSKNIGNNASFIYIYSPLNVKINCICSSAFFSHIFYNIVSYLFRKYEFQR